MKKRIKIVIWGILLLTVFGCGKPSSVYFEEGRTDGAEKTEQVLSDTEECTEDESEQFLYVHVCGAVKNPGVYELLAGSRIFEAVEMAGGLTPEACEDSINQAEELSDGQMIKVLTEEESAEQVTLDTGKETDGRVNINTADAAELMTLPGIGASKAESILSYRSEHGAFSAAEDLMNITGIKEGVYSKIKDHITVN